MKIRSEKKISESSMPVILLVILGFMTLLGLACGQGFDKLSMESTGLPLENQQGLSVFSQSKTTSLVYTNQILANMLSVTGVKVPSQETLDFYQQNKNGISEFGLANSLTSAMVMVIMGLASEVCNDFLTQDISSSGPRAFFQMIDFSLESSAIDDVGLSIAIRSMARAFWGRNETSEERQIILASIRERLGGVEESLLKGDEGTKMMMIYMCAGMLTSLDAIQI